MIFSLPQSAYCLRGDCLIFSAIFQASRESESEPLVVDDANGNNDVPSEQNVLHIFLPIKNV